MRICAFRGSSSARSGSGGGEHLAKFRANLLGEPGHRQAPFIFIGMDPELFGPILRVALGLGHVCKVDHRIESCLGVVVSRLQFEVERHLANPIEIGRGHESNELFVASKTKPSFRRLLLAGKKMKVVKKNIPFHFSLVSAWVFLSLRC